MDSHQTHWHPNRSLKKETNFLVKCWHMKDKWSIIKEWDLLSDMTMNWVTNIFFVRFGKQTYTSLNCLAQGSQYLGRMNSIYWWILKKWNVWVYPVGLHWFFASSVIIWHMHQSQGSLPWPSFCSTEEIIIDKRYWVLANICQLQLFSAKLSLSTVFSRILYTRLQELKVGNCWWHIVDGTSEAAKRKCFLPNV